MNAIMGSCSDTNAISLQGNILMQEARKKDLCEEEARAEVSKKLEEYYIMNAISEKFSNTNTLSAGMEGSHCGQLHWSRGPGTTGALPTQSSGWRMRRTAKKIRISHYSAVDRKSVV